MTEKVGNNTWYRGTLKGKTVWIHSNLVKQDFELDVVSLVNQERVKHGLVPLQVDKELMKVAREKSRDMRVNKYFDHTSPVYGSLFDMLRKFGIKYKTAGENLAWGFESPESVVNGWMDSIPHRDNILNSDYTHIGVGYEKGDLWTQMFIGR